VLQALTGWEPPSISPGFIQVFNEFGLLPANGLKLQMANHKSAEKRARQTKRRTATNNARRSRVRTFIKKVETAIEAGDHDAAREALKLAQPEIARGAGKGALPKNTASRKISRMSARIKALGAAK
jgi:small subunit ribosomal protein S20